MNSGFVEQLERKQKWILSLTEIVICKGMSKLFGCWKLSYDISISMS